MTDDDPSTDELIAGILDHLAENGGRLVISRDTNPLQNPTDKWMVGYEFGQEEPDNPDNDMVGGASYGLGPYLRDCVRQVFDEIGAKVPDE